LVTSDDTDITISVVFNDDDSDDEVSKRILNRLKGNTSYELYLNYAKFAYCVVYYANKRKDLSIEIELNDSQKKKILGALKIALLIEKFGTGILKNMTRVPISYWNRLKLDYWNDILKNQEWENFSRKWFDNAVNLANNENNRYYIY